MLQLLPFLTSLQLFLLQITDWKLADPLCTFLFSIIVLITSITVIRDIFFILMEGIDENLFSEENRNYP